MPTTAMGIVRTPRSDSWELEALEPVVEADEVDGVDGVPLVQAVAPIKTAASRPATATR